MPLLSLEEILEASEHMREYHFRTELTETLVLEGDLDFARNKQYVQFFLGSEAIPQAELFWSGSKGLGRKFHSNKWISLSGEPYPDYYSQTVELLLQRREVQAQEINAFWLVRLGDLELPALQDPRGFLERIRADSGMVLPESIASRVIERLGQMEINLEVLISRESHLIQRITSELRGPDIQKRLSTTFGPSEGFPKQPRRDPKKMIPGQIRPSMLFLNIPNIGGWSGSTHSLWAQKTINLIKEIDIDDGIYAEIYHEYFMQDEFNAGDTYDHTRHHPLIAGTIYEDETGVMPAFYTKWFSGDTNFVNANSNIVNVNYYWDYSGYGRYHHHFGGEDEGLEYQWYFPLNPSFAEPTMPGNRYYSARDWAFGPPPTSKNPRPNGLNFREAINQYSLEDPDATRRAWLIMGHVLHLLQDQGHPDHALLVDHAGSSMSEPEAYETFHYCDILALEAVATFCLPFDPFCSPIVAASTEAGCWDSASDMEFGHEKLIEEDEFSPNDEVLKQRGIQRHPNFNAYFKAVADYAIQAHTESGLESGLGCGWLELIPLPVPNADPDIDSEDDDKTAPYFELTDNVAVNTISACAGFLQEFWEIVNRPPIVERVAVMQWEPRATPEEFATFPGAQAHCMFYEAHWELDGKKRTLQIAANHPLSLDRPAYIFVMFSPGWKNLHGGRRMREISLHLKGIYPGTGQVMDHEVELTEARDDDQGFFYWGSFEPFNCSKEQYSLQMVFEGRDLGGHLMRRVHPGDVLDSDPSTIAYPQSEMFPDHPLMNYSPGPDRNHLLKISTPELTIKQSPEGPMVLKVEPQLHLDGNREEPVNPPHAEVTLSLTQKMWDCHWEPYMGPPKCDIAWTLAPQILKVGRVAPQIGPPAQFGLELEVQPVHRNIQLRASFAASQIAAFGTYRIAVNYEFGDSPNGVTGQIEVVLKVV
ncbi:conserved hypothetical protein [delta proteobacterium NaphS2]|nr:conserved hypothetical protein [delta proteobacterium NaphS2]